MKCLILIPIYLEMLLPNEQITFKRLAHIMEKHPISFLAPEHMRDFLTGTGYDAIYVSDTCMNSRLSYNRLFLNVDFYSRFANYEYILICQLDVFVFHDRLHEFCQLGYDYIGAPSILRRNAAGSYEIYGGNGGFSLRKVSSIRTLLTSHAEEAAGWKGLEDEYFSYCGERYPEEFRVAPFQVAKSFAFDRFARYMYRANHFRLPMAKHAWLIYDTVFTQKLLDAAGISLEISRDTSQSLEQALLDLHQFLTEKEAIYIYGAGMWGTDLGYYLETLYVAIAGYIISDGQEKQDSCCHGYAVSYLSQVANLSAKTGVIVAISRRFIDEQEYDDIVNTLQDNGAGSIFLMDAVLYNAIGEKLLEQRWGDSK